MAKPMTTTDLIKSVKRRAMLPTNDKTFSNQDYIDILNEQLDLSLMPEVLKQHEEYYIDYVEVPTETNKTRYRIPYRAVGNKLRDLFYKDSSGNLFEMSRIAIDDIQQFQNTYDIQIGGLFYLENNDVVLPTQNVTPGDLRFYIHLRPNTLVEEKYCGKIQSIDTVNGIITLESFPTDFANLPLMDFVASKAPNIIHEWDVQPTSVDAASRSVTFDPATLPEGLEVGDYVCKQQETPFPQLPVEMHNILAQTAAVFCLESLGDTEGLANANRRLEQMKTDIDALINNRTEGAPKKIISRHSTMRDSVFRRGYFRRY